jgi:hypothetical protein
VNIPVLARLLRKLEALLNGLSPRRLIGARGFELMDLVRR